MKLRESSEKIFFNADIRKSNVPTYRRDDHLRYICENLRLRKIFQRTLIRCGIIIILFIGFSLPVSAGIGISTDHRSLFFGIMQLGEEKELTQFGTYHNQIACSSTNGNAWYLKINLLQPLTSGAETISLECFKWRLVWTNGKGTVVNPYQFRELNLVPDLVYISGADEATGSSINFQFKYYLKIPETQIAGVYNTVVRFTLTEIL